MKNKDGQSSERVESEFGTPTEEHVPDGSCGTVSQSETEPSWPGVEFTVPTHADQSPKPDEPSDTATHVSAPPKARSVYFVR